MNGFVDHLSSGILPTFTLITEVYLALTFFDYHSNEIIVDIW